MWVTLDNLKDLYDFRRGTGLSAPQIGECRRLFVAEYAGVRRTFINPVLVEASPVVKAMREGCLSFFDFRGMVPRHQKVRIAAYEPNGYRFEAVAEDDEASLWQHEMDHLDGILYIDRLPNKEKDLIRVEGMPVIP